jgi:hypothetical protein
VKVETHPTSTIASGDESTMNVPGSQIKKKVAHDLKKLLRIYRLSVMMWACTRISVRWR